MNTPLTPEQIRAMSDAELNAACAKAVGYRISTTEKGAKLVWSPRQDDNDMPTAYRKDVNIDELWQRIFQPTGSPLHAFDLLREMVDGGATVHLNLDANFRADAYWVRNQLYIYANSTDQAQRLIGESYVIWRQENAK